MENCITDSKGNAKIQNKQYDSVFTDEDLTNMPTLEQSSYHHFRH